MLVYLCAEAIAGRDAWEDETGTRYAVDHKTRLRVRTGPHARRSHSPDDGGADAGRREPERGGQRHHATQGHGTRAATHRASGLGPKDRIRRRATPRRKDESRPWDTAAAGHDGEPGQPTIGQ